MTSNINLPYSSLQRGVNNYRIEFSLCKRGMTEGLEE
jgi:hypothetical protein